VREACCNSKFGAIRYQILRLKATTYKFSISAGAPPQTPLREITALPQTLSLYLREPTSKRSEGEEKGEGKGGEEGRREEVIRVGSGRMERGEGKVGIGGVTS